MAMNIQQAIFNHFSEEVIVDSYYASILVSGKQKIYKPVDFRLRKGHISIPLKYNDIYFKYKVDDEDKTICVATVVLDRYYPEGSRITVSGMDLTVKYYDSLGCQDSCSPRVAIYCCRNSDSSSKTTEVLTINSVENKVRHEVETILLSNKILKDLLPYYSYDWLNYTSDFIDPYQNFVSLKKFYEIFIAERSEYEYKINEMQYYINDDNLININSDLKEWYNKFRSQVNYEKMRIRYMTDTYILFNMISIVKWLLYNKNFDEDSIKIKSPYGHTSVINVSTNDSNDTTIGITTPNCALYNYEILLKDVVRCNVNNAYYDYVMNNIIVYAINKKNSIKIELINLTGMNSTGSWSSSYNIKPAYLYCPYAPYACINGLPAWMINWYETTQRHISEHDDSHSESGSIIDSSVFSDTFFKILCKLMLYICASKESIIECDNVPCVNYYSNLNGNLIRLIEKFKAEVHDDELYVSTLEEFYNKYSALLNKTEDMIDTSDIVNIYNALDELDHLTVLGESSLGKSNMSGISSLYCNESGILESYHDGLIKLLDGSHDESVCDEKGAKIVLDFGKQGVDISKLTIFGKDGSSDEMVSVFGKIDQDTGTYETDYTIGDDISTVEPFVVLRTNGSSQNLIEVIENKWNDNEHKYTVGEIGSYRYMMLYRNSATLSTNISELIIEGFMNSPYRNKLETFKNIVDNIMNLDTESIVVDRIDDIYNIDRSTISKGQIIKIKDNGSGKFMYVVYKGIDESGEMIFEVKDYIYLNGSNDIDNISEIINTYTTDVDILH